MRHVLSVLVQNQPGVLAQVSGMLATRAFNIDSLAVGETEDPHLSRMTIVLNGDDAELEQVRKQPRQDCARSRSVRYIERGLRRARFDAHQSERVAAAAFGDFTLS